MSVYSGVQLALFLVDGYNINASLMDAFTIDRESVTQETMPFGSTSGKNTPINIERWAISVLNGIFDTGTNPLMTNPLTVRGVSRIVCVGYEDNVIGKHFLGFEGAYDTKYVLLDKKDDLVKANLTFLQNGASNEGRIVQNLATFTADWDTKTGGVGVTDAPVDYTADLDQTPIAITSNTLANPTVITSAKPHGLTTGQKVLISGSNSTPTIDGDRAVTVISTTTFSVAVNVTVAGTSGSFVRSSSVAGGVGYLQATAYTGFTGFIDKIMHSPDDSTYAALITFTDFAAVAGPKKERKIVAGTIDRYLSNNGDVTGAGSVTVFTGLSRN